MTRREWLRKYPGHCTACEGHTDSANPCQCCLAFLKCPRCGRGDTLDSEDAAVPCSNCGWREGADHGCPPSRKMIRDEKQRVANEARRDREREAARLRARLNELTGPDAARKGE